MNKDHTLKENIIEAWERYTNKTNTCDDLALILDSIREDDYIQEFEEVADRQWDMAMSDLPPAPEEMEIYRMKAAQLLAENESRQTIQITSRNTVRFRKIFYCAAAAVLLLGLLIPAARLYMKSKTEQTSVQYVETVTQRGEIKTVLLPDQTKVVLNSGSRIKYPVIFTGNERSVELAGEALFDVTSDPARPFFVKTENMNIKVVGTVFDVKDYDDDGLSLVSVASGKVEVGLADGKVMLEQNRQVKMDKAAGNIETMSIDADKYLSWTERALYFYRTPISEVVNMLNRHYPQVDIELTEEATALSYLISGEYENEYTVEVILKSIVNITGLKCKKTANKYTLYNE